MHSVLDSISGKALNRASCKNKSINWHGHNQDVCAASNILAFAALAFCSYDGIAIGCAAYYPTVTSTLNFHNPTPRVCVWPPLNGFLSPTRLAALHLFCAQSCPQSSSIQLAWGVIFIKQIWLLAVNWDIFFHSIPAMIGAGLFLAPQGFQYAFRAAIKSLLAFHCSFLFAVVNK